MRYPMLIPILTLTACVTSPVVSLDANGNYMVLVHTPMGLGSSPRFVRSKAAEAADEYCERSGKTAHMLGTVVPGLADLSGNVVFTCVAPTEENPAPTPAKAHRPTFMPI
ncbi:MAG TPA: hypothetical protein VNH18_04110 [Bryobacteraceae bacterium]|nr:hypothetical protein [Bryobacteraceae bacterium]